MKRKAYERNRRFAPGYTRQPINKSKRKDNMIDITKEKFDEYKKVQMSGEFNMFDPQARAMTTLTKEEWVKIMQEYKKLDEAWGDDK
tara:strand:+ start:207 stop:467 length:261 start_codon:yes stop_codon:yes gene_type:complete